MFCINTRSLELKLEVVPVESLLQHEATLPHIVNKLILEFKNLAKLQNPIIVDENGIITGELEEPVITGITKNEILEFIMNLENVNRDQVIAVGDGSTSSHFIKNGGLSIAFKPGEIGVKTDGIFSSDQIINLLYCLGIPKTELDKYLKEGLG